MKIFYLLLLAILAFFPLATTQATTIDSKEIALNRGPRWNDPSGSSDCSYYTFPKYCNYHNVRGNFKYKCNYIWTNEGYVYVCK